MLKNTRFSASAKKEKDLAKDQRFLHVLPSQTPVENIQFSDFILTFDWVLRQLGKRREASLGESLNQEGKAMQQEQKLKYAELTTWNLKGGQR